MTPSIPEQVQALRRYFHSGATRSLAWRQRQLDGILRLMEENEERLMQALMEDAGKADFTAYSGDLMFVRSEAIHARKRLKRWIRSRKVGTPIILQPGKSRIQPEPRGVVLIIGAWNFPVHLILGPLVGAVSAGNTAVLKPSEVTPRTSAALAELVPRYLDPEAVAVIEGGVPETTEVLEQRFDLILYTGNGHVGRIVMSAAAQHLTPVILELGGKNPCLLARDTNWDIAARRIVDVKCNNAGQICVSPDYLLVHEDDRDAFIDKLRDTITDFFGNDPSQSESYSMIVNDRHFERLTRLMDQGRIVCGGETDPATRYIAPTILVDVPEDAPIMREEIFGPLLPVLTYRSWDEAIDFVNAGDKPLALYVFTENRDTFEQVAANTSSGALCQNSLMMHASNPSLPFGGVGESGMGAYHGQHSFDAMSHLKPVFLKGTRVDPRGAYPPFDEKQMAMRKKITKWLMSR